MAPRDPNKPQLDFPQLIADIITELRLTGQVGLLDFSDVVMPVYIVASRGGALTVTTARPTFAGPSARGSAIVNPAVNSLITDTGPLPAGVYDVYAAIGVTGVMNVSGVVQLQHRDAADAVTLSTPLSVGMTTTNHADSTNLPLIGYTLALNERFRFQVLLGSVTGVVSTQLGFLLRPTP